VGDNAGGYFYELIKDALTEERDRKKSLESRAAFVITSSGTLTTLLLGLIAVTDLEDSSFGCPSRLFLSAGLLMFVAAAFFALRINTPTDHEKARAQGMKDLVETREVWLSDPHDGMRITSENRLATLNSFRSTNRDKADQLATAFKLEFGGLLFVASAVAWLVWETT
jgi:hypothetical protein